MLKIGRTTTNEFDIREYLNDKQARILQEAHRPGREYRVDSFIEDFEAASSGKLREAFGVSDFGALAADSLNRHMTKGYQDFPAVWPRLVSNRRRATDLTRSIKPVFSSVTGDFEETAAGEPLAENLQYTIDDLSYTPKKYTNAFTITMEAMLADDLDQLNRQAQAFGQRAARTLDKFVINDLLEANPSATYPGDSGSTAFFNHNNDLGASAALSIDNIKDAIELMLEQTDANDDPVFIQPRYLLVHQKNVMEAENMLNAERVVQASGSATEPESNVIANRLEVISSPFFSLNSNDAWAVVADPGMHDTLEMAFLDGREEPLIMTEPEDTGESFNRMIRRWAGWLGFGGSLLDPRTWVIANHNSEI